MDRIIKKMILTGIFISAFALPVFAELTRGRVIRVLPGGNTVTVQQLDANGAPVGNLDLRVSSTSQLINLRSLNALAVGDMVDFDAVESNQNPSLPWTVTKLSRLTSFTTGGQAGITSAAGRSMHGHAGNTAATVKTGNGAIVPSSSGSQAGMAEMQKGTAEQSVRGQTGTAAESSSGTLGGGRSAGL